jgi:hypothetical protein
MAYGPGPSYTYKKGGDEVSEINEKDAFNSM